MTFLDWFARWIRGEARIDDRRIDAHVDAMQLKPAYRYTAPLDADGRRRLRLPNPRTHVQRRAM